MLDSIIRTLVPLIVGVVVGQAARVGLDLPSEAVAAIVTPAATAVYYVAARWVEQHAPQVGRALLSAGLVGRSPEYRR